MLAASISAPAPRGELPSDRTLEIPEELGIQSDITDSILTQLDKLRTRLAPITISGPPPDNNQLIDNRCTTLGGRLFAHNERLRAVYHQLIYLLDNLAI